MPYSSYTTYNYSNYSTGRPYTGSKTYTTFSQTPYGSSSSSSYGSNTSTNYSLAPSSTTSFYPYKLSSANSGVTSSSPYGLKSSTSSTVLSNYDSGTSTRRKVSASPSFLSGNTASLRRAFGDSETNHNENPNSYRSRNPNSNTENYADRIYRPPKAMSKVNTSLYTSKLDEADPPKLKEISSTQINLTKPPARPTSNQGDIKRNDAGTISRNRQAVRLTIKRNRDGKKETTGVKKNSIKTVAQKLLDKYTITDKKDSSPKSLHYGPKDRLFFSTTSSSDDAETKSDLDKVGAAVRNESLSPRTTDAQKHETSASSHISSVNNDQKNIYSGARKLSKPGAELEDGVVVFSRATENAVQDADLESAQDVKDMIVAAALHPDVDIESDEEIRQLIEADSGESFPNSPTIGEEDAKKISGRTINPVESIAKRRASADTSLSDGTILMDKLKRFVKQQVSIKKASVKRLSNNGSKKDSSRNGVISVKLLGVKDFKAKRSSSKRNSEDISCSIDDCSVESHCTNFENSLLLEPEQDSKQPLKQPIALIEGMEKIKMSIAVCDNICKNKDESESNATYESGRNSLSSESFRSSCSSSVNGSTTAVIGSLTLGLQPSDTQTTSLEDAPWRKKRSPYINKSKTSANLFSSVTPSDDPSFNLYSLSKSTSSFTLDDPSNRVESSRLDFLCDSKSPFEASNKTASIFEGYESDEHQSKHKKLEDSDFWNLIASNDDSFKSTPDLNCNIDKSAQLVEEHTLCVDSESYDDVENDSCEETIQTMKKAPWQKEIANKRSNLGALGRGQKKSPNIDAAEAPRLLANKKASEPFIRFENDPPNKKDDRQKEIGTNNNRITKVKVGNEDGTSRELFEKKPLKSSGKSSQAELEKNNRREIGDQNNISINVCDGERKVDRVSPKKSGGEKNPTNSKSESCNTLSSRNSKQDTQSVNGESLTLQASDNEKLENTAVEDKHLSNHGLDKIEGEKSHRSSTTPVFAEDENKLSVKIDPENLTNNKEDNSKCISKITIKSESAKGNGLNSENVLVQDNKIENKISEKCVTDNESNKTSLLPIFNDKKSDPEILTARNVLKKRPVDKGVGNEKNKLESNKVTEPTPKKVWKKPSLEPKPAAVDELKQFRNVLKRPGKLGIGLDQKKITAEAQLSPNRANGEGSFPAKPKKLWKKPGDPRANSKEAHSDSEDEESKNSKPAFHRKKKSPSKSPPNSSTDKNSSTTVPDKIAQISPKTADKSNAKASLAGDDRGVSGLKNWRVSAAKTSSAVGQNFSSTVTEATQPENLIGLCASKSADSAYGSSPSTPQPNSALQIDSETCASKPAAKGISSSAAKLGVKQDICNGKLYLFSFGTSGSLFSMSGYCYLFKLCNVWSILYEVL